METYRPATPVSVPVSAAGGATGVSDVVGGVVGDSSNIDKSPDARMSSKNGEVVPEATGTGEQKASVGSNGETSAVTPAAAKPDAPPPTNHPVTAQQMKEYQKAQKKAQEKALKDAKKKGLPPPTATPATAAPGTPAAAAAGTPATAPATTIPPQ